MIYSLNTKNEEQEATLQSLRRIATETQGSLQPAAEGEEGEEFALRTRLLELQAFVEEEQRKGEQAQAEFEIFRLQVRSTPESPLACLSEGADCLKHTYCTYTYTVWPIGAKIYGGLPTDLKFQMSPKYFNNVLPSTY